MTKIDDFNFELPEELIAQTPSKTRDSSKLLIPAESANAQENHITNFSNLVDFLNEGDLLVFNDSRVINAKLELKRPDQKSINVNLNRPLEQNKWLGFARPAKKIKEGDVFQFANHQIIITKKLEHGEIELEFVLDNKSVFEFLDQYGDLPLPPYIKRDATNDSDWQRYQNVYSQHKGSVAAATAGLHFTEELLSKLKNKGIETTFVTLHVGGGTFLPVKTKNINDHKMHFEWCEVSPSTAQIINKTKQEGRRVILVGTTTMRTIESSCKDGIVIPGSKQTNIFIKPGHKFQIADMLITNFHLPKSTLFMLVCAFSGQKEMKELYEYAINNKMRFFSYGDSMLLKLKKT